jgi:alpha-L-fucosidase
VGRGSLLLLNVPPDQRGVFHENDVKALQGFRKLLNTAFAYDFAADATITASSFRGKSQQYSAAMLNDGNKNTYWATDDNVDRASIEINFNKSTPVKYVVLEEFIRLGQRVSKFSIEAWDKGKWKKIADATTIGHKRIIKVDSVQTEKIRVNILASKACPLLSGISVY